MTSSRLDRQERQRSPRRSSEPPRVRIENLKRPKLRRREVPHLVGTETTVAIRRQRDLGTLSVAPTHDHEVFSFAEQNTRGLGTLSVAPTQGNTITATSSASEVDLLGLGSVSAAPTRSPENQVFAEA